MVLQSRLQRQQNCPNTHGNTTLSELWGDENTKANLITSFTKCMYFANCWRFSCWAMSKGHNNGSRCSAANSVPSCKPNNNTTLNATHVPCLCPAIHAVTSTRDSQLCIRTDKIAMMLASSTNIKMTETTKWNQHEEEKNMKRKRRYKEERRRWKKNTGK